MLLPRVATGIELFIDKSVCRLRISPSPNKDYNVQAYSLVRARDMRVNRRELDLNPDLSARKNRSMWDERLIFYTITTGVLTSFCTVIALFANLFIPTTYISSTLYRLGGACEHTRFTIRLPLIHPLQVYACSFMASRLSSPQTSRQTLSSSVAANNSYHVNVHIHEDKVTTVHDSDPADRRAVPVRRYPAFLTRARSRSRTSDATPVSTSSGADLADLAVTTTTTTTSTPAEGVDKKRRGLGLGLGLVADGEPGPELVVHRRKLSRNVAGSAVTLPPVAEAQERLPARMWMRSEPAIRLPDEEGQR
ncbi:uncharacterized protein BXZ73DRAFT_100028 [Epithele typhae]|uniref:uncharacterized protein n=1 Tax=Epithele typhae TaxID=378194 RepID=UPI002007E379|nr:uncharacterized protein BXZ73DRAFT_100028 [Epithele typhae]KAH9937814.1 hypothetical protein BXZ73DRAFT_100028 [Epithele typhae]